VTNPNTISINSTDRPSITDESVSAFRLHASSHLFALALTAPLERLKLCKQVGQPVLGCGQALSRGWYGLLPHAAGTTLYSAMSMLGVSLALPEDAPIVSRAWVAYTAAAITATCVSYPFDVAYTHRASGSLSHRVYHRGLPLAAGISGIHAISSMTSLSFLSLIFPLHKPGDTPSDLDFGRGLVVGYASSFIGSLLVYPADTIRRRVVIGSTIQQAVQQKRFYAGLSWHLVKSVPQCAIFTAAYVVNSRQYFSEVSN